MLGVTAIILALLIAAIPDVGRADDNSSTTTYNQFYVLGNVFSGTVEIDDNGVVYENVGYLAESVSNLGETYISSCESLASLKGSAYEVAYTTFSFQLEDNDDENISATLSGDLNGTLWAAIPWFSERGDNPVYVEFYDITNPSAPVSAGSGQYGEINVTFNHQGGGVRYYMALFYCEDTGSSSGTTSSASSSAGTSSAATSATSDSDVSSTTGSSGETSSFDVNDSSCYSYDIGLLHGTGAYGTLDPEPSDGDWVLTVTNDANSTLRTACEKYAGLSSGAAYQGFLFNSFTKDGTSVSFPEDTILTLTMPLPDSLRDAESVDVRKLAYGSDHTVYPEKVQVQIIPIPDVKDPTNTRNYVQITIPAAKFATATPYAMFATPTEKETDSSSIVMDTPKDSEAEEVPPDTNREDAIDQIWGVGTPKAEPEGLEAADYRMLITSYNQPSAQQLYKKIVQQAGTTKYNKSKSTIYVYDIRLKKTMNDEITYPETPEELGYGSVKITLPVADNLVEDSKTQRGTVAVYALKDNSGLEVILAPTSASTSVTFTASHFSQYAVLYTKGDKKESSPDGGGSSSNNSTSRAASASTTGSSSGGSASTATGSASTATGASSNATTGSSGTGGGGNQASGDQSYSGTGRANTADATTYKALFILILLAFGAFELVSSLPAKRKAKAKRQ